MQQQFSSHQALKISFFLKITHHRHRQHILASVFPWCINIFTVQGGQRGKSSGHAVLCMAGGVGGLELAAREDLVAMETNEPCWEGKGQGRACSPRSLEKMLKWAVSVLGDGRKRSFFSHILTLR